MYYPPKLALSDTVHGSFLCSLPPPKTQDSKRYRITVRFIIMCKYTPVPKVRQVTDGWIAFTHATCHCVVVVPPRTFLLLCGRLAEL